MSWSDELLEQCRRELEALGTMNMVHRVDDARVGVLDVLWAYRLLLGRWPEYSTLAQFTRRIGGARLRMFVDTFVNSVEFRARHSGLKEIDLVVMRELADGFRLFFNMGDRQSVRIAAESHEPEIRRAMLSVLRPGMNCLDMGAHIGLYTLLMGRAVQRGGGRVWAFEPMPRTLELLRRNIAENDLGDTVVLTAAACHAQGGKGWLHVPDPSDLGAVWVNRKGEGEKDGALTVKMVRVDDIVPADVRIDLVKMDIEGNEPFALDGMRRVLQEGRPIIFTEFIPSALGLDPSELLGRLEGMGYEVYEVSEFVGRRRRRYKYQSGTGTMNLVCLPGP